MVLGVKGGCIFEKGEYLEKSFSFGLWELCNIYDYYV